MTRMETYEGNDRDYDSGDESDEDGNTYDDHASPPPYSR